MPYWPRIREPLEGDVLGRGRALALGGAEMFFSNLDQSVGCGGVLSVDQPHDVSVDAAGRDLTLVPCTLSWPGVLTLVNPYYRPTLAYAPRGVTKL